VDESNPINPTDRYELEVSRGDLAQALKTVARAIGHDPGDACFRFADGYLSIEVGTTSADAPARGTWPLPIFVSTSWVRVVTRRMPKGDPIRLRVDTKEALCEPVFGDVRMDSDPERAIGDGGAASNRGGHLE
jgi:hypothetical protein